MSNRTWVQIICRRDDLAALLAIPAGSDPDEEHKLHSLSPSRFVPLTRLVYSETVADESSLPRNIPWLFQHGSYCAEWSCGSVLNNPSFPGPISVANSETSQLPQISVNPQGRVVQDELENARTFWRAIRHLRTHYYMDLLPHIT